MENYIGATFGRLTIEDIIFIEQKNKKRKYFKCKCSCGKEHITRADNVLNGRTFSCGCQRNDHNKGKNYKHFGAGTRLWNIWSGIKQRCKDPNCKCFKRYGGRGIAICKEWENDFSAFRDWAYQNGYRKSLSVDRIDVNGNYCPDNCRWATAKEQCRNRTNNHLISYNGKTMCITEWAEYLGINKGTLTSGINRGRSLDYYVKKYFEGLI